MTALKRNILLTPGPATTTDTVKFAQVVPDICPREQEFGRVMESIMIELTELVADSQQYTTVLFGGSGTAAVESMISSVVGEDTVVIINNGAYGKRMCEIAAAYRLDFIEFSSSTSAPVDLVEFERFVDLNKDIVRHVAVVHHETTTGLLNDITAIGKICSKYDIDLLVDAISSFAAVPIHMETMNVSFLAASSNKCLQGMPGISFVVGRLSKLEDLRETSSRNYYLNLYAQYSYFSKTGQMRFTPPVQTLYALRQALIELHQEGLSERYERYEKAWETLTSGLNRLGLQTLVQIEHQSKLVTCIIEPKCHGFDFNAMHDYLYDAGFTIYPGKLEGVQTFRIANIGDITKSDIDSFLESLSGYLRSIDFLIEER